MARMRMLKPGFFMNETLADVPAIGRLLFAGLWCIADREGRLEDRPKRIKAEVLPYDEVDVNGLLQVLHESGFILRYASCKQRSIQVVNFTKHQSPHIKESASTIPAPCKPGASPVLASDVPDARSPLTESLTDTDMGTERETRVRARASLSREEKTSADAEQTPDQEAERTADVAICTAWCSTTG